MSVTLVHWNIFYSHGLLWLVQIINFPIILQNRLNYTLQNASIFQNSIAMFFNYLSILLLKKKLFSNTYPVNSSLYWSISHLKVLVHSLSLLYANHKMLPAECMLVGLHLHCIDSCPCDQYHYCSLLLLHSTHSSGLAPAFAHILIWLTKCL